MNFRDVPNLSKFEQYARLNSEDEIVMDCYCRVREIISAVAAPPEFVDSSAFSPSIDSLKESCAAVEKSTRLLWACAASLDQILPRIWNYVPDYDSSIEYFSTLEDLELMAVTKMHRISWEENAVQSRMARV